MPDEGQRGESAHDAGRAPGQLVGGLGQLHRAQAFEQQGEGHRAFEAGEGRTDAEVRPVPEGEVIARRPAEVEPVRIGEPPPVPVGRPDQKADDLPLTDGPPVQADRFARAPEGRVPHGES